MPGFLGFLVVLVVAASTTLAFKPILSFQDRGRRCQDGSSCNVEETCCLKPSNANGCCPTPYAVCCADRLYCCPSNYYCDLDNRNCFLLGRMNNLLLPQEVPLIKIK